MYQVFEYLTVGERAYLQTLNRESLKAAQDLNYQYVQQNKTLAAFLLSQEEKIFEYDHFICTICKQLFISPSHPYLHEYQYRYYFECVLCNDKWCCNCGTMIYYGDNMKVYVKIKGIKPYTYEEIYHRH